MKDWIKKHKHSVLLAAIFAAGLIFYAIILLITHRISHSDDYAFQTQIKPFHTLFDWINYRYHTWSGRIFSESFVYIFSPLPLYFWKVVTLILYILFSGFTYLYYLLLTDKRSPIKDYLMMALALLLPLMMDDRVMTEGMLWVTGSMNYFWIASIGLIAFYPFVYYLRRQRLPYWAFCVAAPISAATAGASQEQIGAALSVLSVSFLGYIFYKQRRKKISKSVVYLTILSLIFIASLAISLTAPGNRARAAVETIVRLPDFYTTPLLEHAQYAYRWVIDNLINRSAFLLLICWALLLSLFAVKKEREGLKKVDYITIIILAVSLLFACLKGYNATGHWFNFHATWKPHAPLRSIIVLIPWTLALIATVSAPLLLYRKKVYGYLLSALFALAILLTIVITFSPSMYASGFRVFYVPSLLLVFAAYLLFDKVFNHYKKFSYIIFATIICLAGSQYIILVGRILKP